MGVSRERTALRNCKLLFAHNMKIIPEILVFTDVSLPQYLVVDTPDHEHPEFPLTAVQ